MTFSSLTFLVFLTVVFAAYWLLRERKSQNLLLLMMSYVFYGWWDWRFCGLMLLSSLMDFGFGMLLHRTDRARWRKSLLALSVVANLALLGFFKYYNFFAESFAEAAGSLGWNPGELTLNIILPVGISFYTFQSLSYTIDIYRRELEPTKSLVDYLAFVSFFPQLVAGPIERACDLLPQFGKERQFDAALATDGLRQMLWGLFKKVAVADRLALLVNPVYENPGEHSGIHLMFATICFAFQIYCDFSGYSDMAIGCARQFGIRLSRNFAYPYFSQDPREFWRRWHISLSTWFRDYVYIPLGGSRGGSAKNIRNLMVTFVVSGFWHGAAWTYLAWGAINGLLVAVRGPRRKKAGPRTHTPGGDRLIPGFGTLARMGATFTAICFCWIFFRAVTWSDALLIVRRIGGGLFERADALRLWNELSLTPGAYATLTTLLVMLAIEWLGRRHDHPLAIARWPRPVRWTCYTVACWATLLLIPEGAGRDFIYFDF